MKWKVLVSSIHMQSRLDQYKDLLDKNNIECDIVATKSQFVPESDLLEIIEPYDAIICSDDEITDKVLERARNLKIISKWGVGINSIDLVSAKRRGIEVLNSPGAFSESCAVMIFSYILHFARDVAGQDRLIRSGKWEHGSGFALSGKTMGIIGVGNIGKAAAVRAKAFGMEVVYHDIKEVGVPLISKEELLRRSDFVVLTPDLNKTSYHLMSAHEFSLMKSTAYIINTSRGPVIDEVALIDALKNKTIKGAGLDVFEVEPLPLNSPLRFMDNVVLTPHNAFNTIEAENYVHDNTIKNLISGLKKLKSK